MTQSLNSNPTQENLLSIFQNYSTQALREQNQDVIETLRRRQIDTTNLQNLEDVYKIYIKLESPIRLGQIKKPLQQQIDAIAQFIKNFYIGILGQRNTLFNLYEVEIFITQGFRSSTEFEAGKLLIKLSYWNLFLLKDYLSYPLLKTLWKRGKHLDKLSPIYRYWWLFNPVGEIRSSLRAMLLVAVENQILGIDKLLSKIARGKASDRRSLSPQNEAKDEKAETTSFRDGTRPSSVRQEILTLLKDTVNEDKLGINLEQVLKDQDDDTLIQLLALFKKNLADPNQIEEILNAGMLILKETLQEEQSHLDIKMFGFVNVGNYHRIDVAVNFSSGYLKKYIDVIPRKNAIKAILFGFVNVYTIDDITVKPNFQGVMKLNFETVALERALRELQLLV